MRIADDDRHLIHDPAQLEALYGTPGEASVIKEVDHIHPHYAAFIRAAPFAVLATAGPGGLDAGPRGAAAG
ncbi:flavin-nucleotide-binding protein, partial [Roseomonas sp. NAR14]|nr:flavin-nucleotide-binding protein [Roseomonas acroporae]